jgi:hypothetical protein
MESFLLLVIAIVLIWIAILRGTEIYHWLEG